MLKLKLTNYSTGCYALPNEMDQGYPEFGFHLNRTGRPMIYACSWPVYQTYSGMEVRFQMFKASRFVPTCLHIVVLHLDMLNNGTS